MEGTTWVNDLEEGAIRTKLVWEGTNGATLGNKTRAKKIEIRLLDMAWNKELKNVDAITMASM